MAQLMTGESIADLCDVHDGLTTCETYILADLIDESKSAQERSVRFVSASTIKAYHSLWGAAKTTIHRKEYVKPVLSISKLEHNLPNRCVSALSRKIVVCGDALFRGFLDRDGLYLAGKGTVILSEFRKSIDPDFLLGVLNSKFVRYLQRSRYHSRPGGQLIKLSASSILSLRVGRGDRDIEMAVTERVRAIISAKQKDSSADTKGLECEIDQKLAKLYGLSTSEVADLDV